jgi:hypothetical protein
MTDKAVVMPSFAAGFFGFRHTVSSALEVLAALGVPASRVTLRMAGLGDPSRWIVEQDPRAGTTLDGSVMITLSVAGPGYFHALPVGMWDRGAERELGTKEVVELLDDPLQKATHWMREGARLFELRPDNLAACGRWISLFGLNPDDWPTETWYNLSLLLPSIQELAATRHGIPLIFQLLLQLPVKEIAYFPSVRRLESQQRSLVGDRACRLGVDCIVGDRVDDLAGLELVIGPVTLAQYYDHQRGERRALLSRVLDLSVSCHRRCRVAWTVLDASRPPRLGCETENARLGINSHLGAQSRQRLKVRTDEAR